MKPDRSRADAVARCARYRSLPPGGRTPLTCRTQASTAPRLAMPPFASPTKRGGGGGGGGSVGGGGGGGGGGADGDGLWVRHGTRAGRASPSDIPPHVWRLYDLTDDVKRSLESRLDFGGSHLEARGADGSGDDVEGSAGTLAETLTRYRWMQTTPAALLEAQTRRLQILSPYGWIRGRGSGSADIGDDREAFEDARTSTRIWANAGGMPFLPRPLEGVTYVSQAGIIPDSDRFRRAMRDRLGMVRIATASEPMHPPPVGNAAKGQQDDPSGWACEPAAACVASGISTLALGRGHGWLAALTHGVCAVTMPSDWLAIGGGAVGSTEATRPCVTVFGRTVRDLHYAVGEMVASRFATGDQGDDAEETTSADGGSRSDIERRPNELRAHNRGSICVRWRVRTGRQAFDRDASLPHREVGCSGGVGPGCVDVSADGCSVSTVGVGGPGCRRGGWPFPPESFVAIVPWQVPSPGNLPVGIAVVSTPIPCNVSSVFVSALRAERTDFRPCRHLPKLERLREGIPRAVGASQHHHHCRHPVGC